MVEWQKTVFRLARYSLAYFLVRLFIGTPIAFLSSFTSEGYLADSLYALMVLVTGIGFTDYYFKRHQENVLRDAFVLGAVWFAIGTLLIRILVTSMPLWIYELLTPMVTISTALVLSRADSFGAKPGDKSNFAARRALLYGLIIWAIHFAYIQFMVEVWYGLYLYKPLVISAIILFSCWLFFRGVRQNYLQTGILLGAIWFIVISGFDTILLYADILIRGDDNWVARPYFMTDGPFYLFIPLLTIHFGYLIAIKKDQILAEAGG